MDYAELARKLGGSAIQAQPVQQPAPGLNWAQNLPPKDQNEVRMKLFNEGQQRVNELRDILYKGEQNLNMLSRFGELNQQNSTGGLVDYFNANGGFLQGDAEREMESISSQLAPQQRIAGSGASSDRDVAMFLQSLPSVKNKGSVNKGIRENYQKQFNYAQSKVQFLESWLQKNGNLVGADAAWLKYKSSAIDPKTNTPKADTNLDIYTQADAIISGGR